MNTLISAPPGPQYSVRDGDPVHDRDAVLALWHGNLGESARMAGKYGWFYQNCPFGPPLLLFLHHIPTATRVGTCTAGGRRMLWQGREIKAGVLVDLAVLPQHRSLGPALMLQQGMIEWGRRRFDLLYGFPNAKAVPVFKRVGYVKLADITRYVRVIRHAGYLRRKMPAVLACALGAGIDLAVRFRDMARSLSGPRLHVQWSTCADPRFDTLWMRSSHGHGLIAIRDWQYANWRFDEEPAGSTRYLLLSESSGGDLCCWFATHVANGTLHVRDFWSVDAVMGITSDYIDALLSAARMAGHESVSVEIATSETRLLGWHSCGFTERSNRPVLGCWSEGSDATTTAWDMHLTSADEDE